MDDQIFYKLGNKNDINNFLLFYKKFYPNSGWNKKYIEWEYSQNPFGKAKIFIATYKKKLVGITTAIPIWMQLQKKIYKGYRTQNVLTDINYRGKGIFSNLLLKNNQYLDHPSYLNITFPNEHSLPFFIKTNWSEVSNISFLEKKITKVEKKLLNYRFISKFDDIHKNLWEKNLNNRIDILCNKKYLNWRFFTNPKSKYIVFEILQKSKVIGFIVLKKYISKTNEKNGHICKLVCPKNYLKDAVSFANNFFYDLSFDKLSLWKNHNSNLLVDQLSFTKKKLKNLNFLYKSKKKISITKWDLSMSHSDVF